MKALLRFALSFYLACTLFAVAALWFGLGLDQRRHRVNEFLHYLGRIQW